MNSFGTIFRVNIFGESHGPAVGVIVDGCPAGIAIQPADFEEELLRRQGGNLKATTPRKEDDIPEFLSGIYNGFSTGSPITIRFANNNTRSEDYGKHRAIPRPGHADFVAQVKYKGFEDHRGGGHFSGRLTVGLVAAGVIARKVLHQINPSITVVSKILEVGGMVDMEAGIQKAIEAKDSIGGIVDCHVKGLPIGLGEPFFDSVESMISHAVFAIPAIRGIEFGSGFAAANMFGLEHNDSLLELSGKTETNHAGGVVGGLTNGNDLVFRVAVKPTSSTPQVQSSLNLDTNRVEEFSVKGRHDLCIALRVPPVLEAVTACVLADLFLRKNGGIPA